MTRLASGTDGAAVPIRMTRDTLRTQPEERLVGVGNEQLVDIRGLDILCLVTLFALDRMMGAGKQESGLCVIKLGFVESCDLLIFPEMFFVARNTRTARVGKMKAAPCLDEITDLDVTRQTLGSVDFLSALVTLCAV